MRQPINARFALVILVATALLLPGCSGRQVQREGEVPGGLEATVTPEETTPSVEVTESAEGSGTALQLQLDEQDAERFAQMARDSGLIEATSELGPYTVLAPTNEALDRMGEARLNELGRPENRGELAQLVALHIIPGRWSEQDMQRMGVVPTLSGLFIPVTMQGGTLVLGDGARIETRAQESTVGVVFTIDRVLEPQMGAETPDMRNRGMQRQGPPSTGSTMTTP